MEDEWYQVLRNRWKPEHVRLLLVGESPPDDGGESGNRRFFYTDLLSQYDNLFRAVIEALYNKNQLSKGEPKAPWLERLRDDGVYLIDLATIPINGLAPPIRRRARRASVQGCLQTIGKLSPEGIVVCHKPTFELLARPMQAASMPLLHHVGTASHFPCRTNAKSSSRGSVQRLLLHHRFRRGRRGTDTIYP